MLLTGDPGELPNIVTTRNRSKKNARTHCPAARSIGVEESIIAGDELVPFGASIPSSATPFVGRGSLENA
jgi:hypothetical protein